MEFKEGKQVESLFKIAYESLSFDDKRKYMSLGDTDVEDLDGVRKISDITIMLTSDNDNFNFNNKIVNSNCVVFEDTKPYDDPLFIGYTFVFDSGYIEIVYKIYIPSPDIGDCLYKPISSKIIIGDVGFDGFFKAHPSYDRFGFNQNDLYQYIMTNNQNLPLEFRIGLDMPEPESDYESDEDSRCGCGCGYGYLYCYYNNEY